LKTAAALLVAEIERQGEGELEYAVPDVAAEFQAAAVDVLVTKTMRAVELTGCDRVLLGGGVACNMPLRAAMADALDGRGELFAPQPRLATDNAGMVARVAEHRLRNGERSGMEMSADAGLPFPGLNVSANH